jgi:hypothetical protein
MEQKPVKPAHGPRARPCQSDASPGGVNQDPVPPQSPPRNNHCLGITSANIDHIEISKSAFKLACCHGPFKQHLGFCNGLKARLEPLHFERLVVTGHADEADFPPARGQLIEAKLIQGWKRAVRESSATNRNNFHGWARPSYPFCECTSQ